MPTMLINAIIYARYSTDRQRETSIEDQSRVCRTRAEALALVVVAVQLAPAEFWDISWARILMRNVSVARGGVFP
ncbi:MAG: recombinase family protein [Betaproteobacteria bacterium]